MKMKKYTFFFSVSESEREREEERERVREREREREKKPLLEILCCRSLSRNLYWSRGYVGKQAMAAPARL